MLADRCGLTDAQFVKISPHLATYANAGSSLFMLTGDHVADCTASAELLARMPAFDLNRVKGYDSDALFHQKRL